jgi:hypothetical protein
MAGEHRSIEGIVRMVSAPSFRDGLASPQRRCGKAFLGLVRTLEALLWSSAILVAPVFSLAPARSQPLPPPPTVSVPDLTPQTAMPPLTAGTTTSAPFPEVSPNAVYRPPASDRPIPSDRYIVYINGNSPLLLQAVQTTVPNAFLAQYQGRQIIQTGTFGNVANAQRQVSALTANGIQADILTANHQIPAPNPSAAPTPDPTPQSLPAAPSGFNTRTTQANYLVIIPASPEAFNALTAEAVRLGIRQDAIQPRQAPFGPHLEIGPFAQRTEAEEVNRYLRKQGMDARVFFNR